MPSKVNYQKQAREILESFMQKGLNYENRELSFLASKWSIVSGKLEDMITQLSAKEVLSLDQLFRLDLYQKFLKQSNYEVAKFNNLALSTIKDGQEFFAHLGIDATQDSIELITTRFYRLPFDAVNNMIGLSSDGSKLSTLLSKSYPESVDKLSNILIQGTGLGLNPTKTARLMAQSMDGNLMRAMRIARTEQLMLTRISALEQMEKSGVVKGWVRIEQPDACDGCQEVNGKEYNFDEKWDSDYNHPNCRGAAMPNI